MTELKGWALAVLSACLMLRVLEWMGIGMKFEKHLRMLFGITFALVAFSPLVGGDFALPQLPSPPVTEETEWVEENLLTLVEQETETRLKAKLEGIFSKLEIEADCREEADGGVSLSGLRLTAPKEEKEKEATAGWRVYQSTGIWPEFCWEE